LENLSLEPKAAKYYQASIRELLIEIKDM